MKSGLASHPSDEVDLPEILIGVDENLQFVKGVLDSSELPEPLKLDLHRHIEQIHQRRSDPNLYLAVIGEFSSGKSTFINALLRDELLKTSALVATAAVTRLRHSSEIKVAVQWKNPQMPSLLVDSKTKLESETWSPDLKTLDIRQLIQAVTSEEGLAAKVLDVRISHPKLSKNIVIIDTPGTNATQAEHGAITQQIVEKEADIAVIVLAATTPLPQTLISFLRNSLQSCLHRCVFLVTKMDQIPQRQQYQVIEHIQARLAMELGLEQPVLLTAAPQLVIDDLSGEEVPAHLHHWQDEFLKLEDMLWNYLRQERSLSVTENLLRLLTHLFEQLDTPLQNQWEAYQHRQTAIEQERIQDLDTFTAQHLTVCHQWLEKAVSESRKAIHECIQGHREQTIVAIRKRIFAIDDWVTLSNMIQQGVFEALQENQTSLQKDIQRNFEKLAATVADVERYFEQNFAEAYCRLQALGGHIEIHSRKIDSDLTLNASQTVEPVQKLLKAMDDGDIGSVSGGAVTGALIGTSIMPGIGTIVGGLIGALGVGMLTSLKQRKTLLWDKLRPSLYCHFDRVKGQAEQVVKTYEDTATAALRQQINAYVDQYRGAVEAILKDEQEELQHLQRLQATVKADLEEIDRRRQILLAKQQKLATIKTQYRMEESYV